MPSDKAMTDVATARPDLKSLLETQYLPDEIVLKEFAQYIGMELVAYVAAFRSPDEVNAYCIGRSYRQAEIRQRLKLGLRIAKLIFEVDGGNVAAWFQGLNPQLSDASPAWLLREGELKDVEPLLLAAARAYAVGG